MRSKIAYLFLVLIIAIPAVLATTYLVYDEIQLLIEHWASGTPKMLIKLYVEVPPLQADFCAVSVERFLSNNNPTRNGYPEEIHYVEVSPGTTIMVRNILKAVPMKFSREDPSRVEYYEPQRYFVFVACVKNGRTVFSGSRVVEVFPKSIISEVRVNMEEKKAYVLPHDFNGEGGWYYQNPCNITITWEGWEGSWYVKRGVCVTWVRGPWLHSFEGASTRLRLEVYPRVSAVYIEAYGYSTVDLGGRESDVVWESAGRVLTPAVRSSSTAWLSGNFKDRVYFQVQYVYEYKYRMSERGDYMVRKWALYPRFISAVVRSGDPGISSFPFYDQTPYQPSSTIPPYARISPPGTSDTLFLEPEQSDVVLSEVVVSFSYSGVWAATLIVKVYRAGINDFLYTTPIHTTNSTVVYYWWYKDNDPMTYEIQLAPRYP